MHTRSWIYTLIAAQLAFVACHRVSDDPAPSGPVPGEPPSTEAQSPAPESRPSTPSIDAVPEALRSTLATLDGEILIDGSSTVYPLTEAIVQIVEPMAPNLRASLGVSGTGGGFEKFCQGEIDISAASRPIKETEFATCQERGIELVELPIAFDGLTVVVHPDNHWASCMTVDELRRLWEPEAEESIVHWSHLRNDWPGRPITLYAPGKNSGTFDYFTKSVIGSEGVSRGDFVGSEDDYLLAQDVAADPAALGFFGYAYYHEYRDVLKSVDIDPGTGCVEPNTETIVAGNYRPLSRPIFLYASLAALERPEVSSFLEFYLSYAEDVAPQVRYVPLPQRAYALSMERLLARRTGSLFDGGSQVGVSISELLELAGQ